MQLKLTLGVSTFKISATMTASWSGTTVGGGYSIIKISMGRRAERKKIFLLTPLPLNCIVMSGGRVPIVKKCK